MEPLLKQLSDLPKKFAGLSRGAKIALISAVVLSIGLAVAATTLSSGSEYQYAYTGLSTEDSAEISAQLKTAGVPFRFEAGGTALSVPASRVYDVRMLLAASGLPRSSGSGFELFDKGDFGVSEFTQKINLRRATEGELARTIGSLAGVRSARVHLVLQEKGVFRGDERQASAAVKLDLQPGRTLTERELAGMKHLVASAVASLSPDAVTIVDGRGAVLSGGDAAADGESFQKRLQRDLETKVVSLLEPVVGAGKIEVRVQADVDTSDVTTTANSVDPDSQVVVSESTKVNGSQQQSGPANAGGVAGAAANQPMNPQQQQQGTGGTQSRSSSNGQEEMRNYDASRTTTRTVLNHPRVTRLSLAILVDGVDGKPRTDAEVQRLGELARKAVGFDAARGDQLEISSAVFMKVADEASLAGPAGVAAGIPAWVWGAAGGGLLVLVVLVFALLRRRAPVANQPLLRPGASVAELEADAAKTIDAEVKAPAAALDAKEAAKALPEPAAPDFREKARQLALSDPSRAAHLLRAWINPEGHREPKNA